MQKQRLSAGMEVPLPSEKGTVLRAAAWKGMKVEAVDCGKCEI